MPQSLIDKLKKVHCKPVRQFTKSGGFVEQFTSIKDAEKKLGLNRMISRVCNGKRKTAGGFRWEFV